MVWNRAGWLAQFFFYLYWWFASQFVSVRSWLLHSWLFCWCYCLRGRYSFNQSNAVGYEKAFVSMWFICKWIWFIACKSKFLLCITRKLQSMFNNLNLNGFFFILVVDLLKTSPHIPTLGTLLIVIEIIKMMCCTEDVILLFKQTMYFCFFKTLDMHIKIKLFKFYCSSIYGSELWSLEDDVLHDFCCS